MCAHCRCPVPFRAYRSSVLFERSEFTATVARTAQDLYDIEVSTDGRDIGLPTSLLLNYIELFLIFRKRPVLIRGQGDAPQFNFF